MYATANIRLRKSMCLDDENTYITITLRIIYISHMSSYRGSVASVNAIAYEDCIWLLLCSSDSNNTCNTNRETKFIECIWIYIWSFVYGRHTLRPFLNQIYILRVCPPPFGRFGWVHFHPISKWNPLSRWATHKRHVQSQQTRWRVSRTTMHWTGTNTRMKVSSLIPVSIHCRPRTWSSGRLACTPLHRILYFLRFWIIMFFIMVISMTIKLRRWRVSGWCHLLYR